MRTGRLPTPGPVEFIATHASFVFLTPRDVYKIKRPKNYGFFDYSTLAARKHFCEEELRLNRRTAPDVYLEVLPIERDGAVVDYAVHMRRLPDERSLKAGVGHGELAAVARFMADFYRRAAGSPNAFDSFRRTIRDNFEQVRPYVGRFIDAARFEET